MLIMGRFQVGFLFLSVTRYISESFKRAFFLHRVSETLVGRCYDVLLHVVVCSQRDVMILDFEPVYHGGLYSRYTAISAYRSHY